MCRTFLTDILSQCNITAYVIILTATALATTCMLLVGISASVSCTLLVMYMCMEPPYNLLTSSRITACEVRTYHHCMRVDLQIAHTNCCSACLADKSMLPPTDVSEMILHGLS